MPSLSSMTRGVQDVWQQWRGQRDVAKLTQLGCAGQILATKMAAAETLLRPHYEDYVSSVSTREMAVSLETACYLFALAELRRPMTMVDLGSGFSSFVLRTYAQRCGHKCEVTSIDDHAGWLDQTIAYLKKSGLSAERVIAWEDFTRHIPPGGFDLVFHDMGSMQLRATSLPLVLKTVSMDGLLVLDDMHKHRYRGSAHRSVQQFGWRTLSARGVTLDPLGRFSEVAVRRAA